MQKKERYSLLLLASFLFTFVFSPLFSSPMFHVSLFFLRLLPSVCPAHVYLRHTLFCLPSCCASFFLSCFPLFILSLYTIYIYVTEHHYALPPPSCFTFPSFFLFTSPVSPFSFLLFVLLSLFTSYIYKLASQSSFTHSARPKISSSHLVLLFISFHLPCAAFSFPPFLLFSLRFTQRLYTSP